jgi:hypothetical protein
MFLTQFFCLFLFLAVSFLRSVDHTQLHITVGRTPLHEIPLPDNTNTQETNIHAPSGIRTCNPSKQAAVDSRLFLRQLLPSYSATNYKVVQIWPRLFVCKQVTVCPGHIWTTLYLSRTYLTSGSTASDQNFLLLKLPFIINYIITMSVAQ